VKLQADLTKIRAAGGDVIAATVDPISTSRSVAKQLNLGYPIIEDVSHHLGDAFGDYHLVSGGMDMGSVDNHAVFVLNKRGVVRWKDMAGDTMNVDESDILRALARA
jgi:peroxiredoxin